MADENEEIIEEIEEEIELDEEIQPESKVEKRIKQLSNKVKLTSSERDELVKGKQKLETERDTAKKEVEFYSSFSDTTDKYPNAKEYKDKIKEKVLAGYSVEDAAVAVLAKEGKLDAIKAVENPAGGSALNPPMLGEPKPLNDMSREEKRTAIIEAEKKGDISLT